MKNSGNSDYEFIVKIIDYFESKCNISFFITSKDFDVLYKWWEKKIPLKTIEKSIIEVCRRWNLKKKQIYSFSNFEYEVKKNHKKNMELNVNVHEDIEIRSVSERVDDFFRDFPKDLMPIKKIFENEVSKIKRGSGGDLNSVYSEMVLLFKNDNELKLRKKIFLKNLMPGLVNPELEKKFEINYLKKRYRIPDFELLVK